MSNRIPTRPAKIYESPAPRVAIVASEYNPEFVQSLVNNTCKELYSIDRACVIELFNTPGSFELPVAAAMIAGLRKFDIIIALGVIMQGETKHADLVATSVSNALQQVAIKHVIPIINEVLLVNSEAEAQARCSGTEINRGIEAARAVFTMLRMREQVRQINTATR